ncbi:MAG: glycine cleavage system protein GcvH [bacterium]
MIPENLKFSQTHEWVKVENGEAVIGVTDYAVEKLGDVVFVELPSIGRKINQKESFGVVESVKAVSDLYSPVTGKVTAINGKLSASPELLNKDPYGEGWIIKIEIKDSKEISNLLSAKDYEKFIQKEG